MAKKYYAYLLSENKKGICDDWKECEKLVKGAWGARYRGFKTKQEAEDWLAAGAQYEKRIKKLLEAGIYFDAGTGRGKGVEISVTDENGENLLHKVIPKSKINKFGKHLLDKDFTNNYGELLACQYALKLAIKKGIKKIFGDSKLVIEYWSRGFMKRKELPVSTIKLADKVMKLRKEFEVVGGKISRVSGDDNPADLGFHR